ncbi:Zn-ribbon containing protein [Halorubrum trapanicum]|uniref:OapC/ArvC family zinc-ribbon domain-containing protein n=1 Tax=Halorubrum trapanicum TaxID=29284 RepID=UPI000BBAC51F|nr:Zn-ribbon containing protein [Halorubrum trapanicum]
MPHQCTSCGRTFPDGSKEMLSGCPDCGGNKFQFKPAGATGEAGADEGGRASGSPADAADPSPPTPEDRPAPTPDDGAADPTPSDPSDATPSDAAASADAPAESDGTEQIADRSDEDTAQASARSEVVSPDELDRASRDVEPAETPPAEEGPEPGIDALRDELNDQFESIRIVSPGQYELNLMELYDRQEYIISLQEDGRYVIEMPDAWGIQDE